MRRLVLHIGTEKTATTTLQQFLQSNRKQLLKDGWILPRSLGEPSQRKLAILCNDDSFVDPEISRLGLATFKARSEACSRWATAFVREIASAQTPNMVISSEHLSSRLFTQTEMDRLRRFLLPHFEMIDVVVVLRDPLSAALSLLSTQIRHMGLTNATLPAPPSSWGLGNERSWISVCDHRQTLQRWESAFPGRVNARIFESASLKGGSIVSEFKEILGVAEKRGYSESSYANESISAVGLELLARLNHLIPRSVDGKPSPYRKDLSEWVSRYFKSCSKLSATESQMDAYTQAFLESNEWVRANYFPDRKTLFTPNLCDNDSQLASSNFNSIEIEAIAELVAALWKSHSARNHQFSALNKVRSISKKLVKLCREG